MQWSRVLPPTFHQWLRHHLDKGYPLTRYVLDRDVAEEVRRWQPEQLEAAEVSGDGSRSHGWKSFETLAYPDFDLCDGKPPARQYDVVICEQVLEHVPDPIAAAEKLAAMTVPGGRVVVSTPFLIRVHGAPSDYWRFTPDGLQLLLERAGLMVERVESWGNAFAVHVTLTRWRPYRRGYSLRNDPLFPVSVWAYARKPLERLDLERDRLDR